MEAFIYLAKVSGCMAAFYLVYYTMFRRLTFFTLNRWYLLSALVASLAIPLLHFDVTTTLPAPVAKPTLISPAAKVVHDVVLTTLPTITAPQPIERHTNWVLIATIAYFVIAGLLLLKLLVALTGILYKGIKYGERQNGYRLVNGIKASNSSFFGYVFLNAGGLDDHEREQVISHELVHVRLLHSADNLFTEVLKAALWFNPFVYLFAKALHQAHEFEVDRHLALQYNSKSYAGLLLKLSNPARVGMSNQFSAYGLKTRVQMLFGKQSASAKRLAYLLVLPLVAGLVYVLAVQHVYAFAEDTHTDGKDFVLVLDAGHGGNSGAHAGNILESDIALAMVKQIKAVADTRGIKTVLTRTDATDIPLADRVKAQGDAFVSLHVNSVSGKTNSSATGMEVISDRHNTNGQTEKLATAVIGEMLKLKGIAMSGWVYRQGIAVLRENKAPAILLELGYLTNKHDVKYITDPQNQHAIAERFVDAIIAYKNCIAAKPIGTRLLSDTNLRKMAKANANSATQNKTIAQTSNTDTAAVEVKAPKQGWGLNMGYGHMNLVNVQYTNNDREASKDDLYNEFKAARYTAKDSVKADMRTNKLQLYNAEISMGKFTIKADRIIYDKRDSLLSASGNVQLIVRAAKNTDAASTLRTDSLNLFLNVSAKMPAVRRH